MKESFTDDWGQTWYEGGNVIGGLWYERPQPKNWTYHLNENSPLAQVYSHLVTTFKFLMPLIVHVLKGNFTTYELSKDVSRIIKGGLEDFRLLDND